MISRGRWEAFALLLGLVAGGACSEAEESPPEERSALVDPFIGTGGLGFGVGSIVPGPTLPFGFAKPAPDTSKDGVAPGFSHCAGYYYEDTEVRAFSQIHLSGTGVPDYGALALMPVLDASLEDLDEDRYRSRFDHARERAEVGEYRVTLLDPRIEVRVGATTHTALYEIQYPAGSNAGLVLNLDHGLGGGETVGAELEVSESGRELSGWLHHRGDISGRFGGFRLYFVARWSQSAGRVEVAPNGRIVLIQLGTASTAPLGLQVGLSFVDVEGARRNLDAEWMDFDVEKAKQSARAAWEDVLARVAVEGGSEVERRKLYTALYHVFQMPTVLTDVDGRYPGFDREIHQATGFTYYSDFSLWDTYRTVHPLLVLIAPEIQADFNRSLVDMLEKGGHLPQWPLATGYTWTMLGNHGETMLVDSFLKGVEGFDPAPLFEHLVRAATSTIDRNGLARSGRECLEDYASLGYCSLESGGGSVSNTLENAFNDWALANFADALGRGTEVENIRPRGASWRKLFNPATGHVQGRHRDGSFGEDFRADLFSGEFVEGNARQWTVFVPHDVAGLAEAMGGTEELVRWLEDFFENASLAEDSIFPDLWYWHGNEPDIHAAYMFAELGRPDLTARWVRWIMDERYDETPAGLDGNDDGGTLSAWYVLSALGLFPRTGSAEYILGIPRFARATIALGGGRSLVIRAEGPLEGPIKVDRIELDGTRLEGAILRHQDLLAARELVFFLSSAP